MANKTKIVLPWIIRNILISVLAGAWLGSVLGPLSSALWHAHHPIYYYPFNLKHVLLEMLCAPIFLVLLFPFLLGLTGIILAVGIIFQESIEKHLALWCSLSPILFWLIFIALDSISRINYGEFSWLERFLIAISKFKELIMLIPACFSSLVFYILSAKKIEQTKPVQ